MSFLILFELSSPLVSEELAALDALGKDEAEAKAELLSFKMGDSDVSLFLDGSWKGTATASGGIALTELGAAVASTETPFLFEQEADLTLELTIQDRWFVEASFLDDYDLNTYRAGYRGAEGETIRYIGVGNTGLDFPSFPYLDLGGDAPSSFGAYGAFGSGPLTIHALVRYDSATREEKVFVGGRERTITDLSISNRLRGRSFVLPDFSLDSSPMVYLEDADGNLSGSDGRVYRKALSSEFASSARYGLVELEDTPSGRVAVVYSKNSVSAPWQTSLGTYSGSGFLAEAQAAFQAQDDSIDLADYPQVGEGDDISNNTDIPATITIDGTQALVIYESGAFSPFERANRYQEPSSSSSSTTASVVRVSDGIEISDYELINIGDLEELGLIADLDNEDVLASSRSIYELLPAKGSSSRRSVDSRWPALAEAPEVFLPGAHVTTADIAVRFISYGSAGDYNIGTDVVSGSVQVYRDGLIDSLASYDEDTGTVTLSNPASANEVIRISYLKRSDERRFGSIAAGLGAVYDPDGPFSARGALGIRWNISGSEYSEYSEYEATNPGTIGLSGEVSWKDETLKASLSSAITYENPDTTGLYRVTGMEGSELVLEIDEDDSFSSQPPENRYTDLSGLTTSNKATLIYRDYGSTDILGSTTLQDIDWSGSEIDEEEEGPYAVSDDSFSSEILVAEFTLGAGARSDGEDALWAGFQSRLPDEASALERAKQIRLPYRFYDFDYAVPFQVYVQFGALADPDEDESESSALVVTELIYDSESDGSPSSSWDIKTLSLTDDDRKCLADARSMRILVRLKNTTVSASEAVEGRLLIGPPTSIGASFRPITVDSDGSVKAASDSTSSGVAAVEGIDSTLRASFSTEIDRLHPDGEDQRVLEIAWDGTASDVSIGVDGRTKAIPVGDYRGFTLFVRGPEAADTANAESLSAATLRIAFADGPNSLDDAAIDVRLPLASFTPGEWQKLEITYEGSDVRGRLNDDEIQATSITYRRDTLAERGGADPSYIIVLIEPSEEGTALPGGSCAIDEITLGDPAPAYGVSLGGSLAWEKSGTALSLFGHDLVSNLETQVSFDSNIRGDPFTDGSDATARINSREDVAATILGARVSGKLAAGAGPTGVTWSASHGASIPIGPLTIKDAFSLDPDDETRVRQFGVGLSEPFMAEVSAKSSIDSDDRVRAWKTTIATSKSSSGESKESSRPRSINTTLSTNAKWTESIDDFDTSNNYATAWMESWEELAPDVGEQARKRIMSFNSETNIVALPLGITGIVSGGSAAYAIAGSTESTATARLQFPAVFGDFKSVFGVQRSFTRTMDEESEDATGDGKLFASAIWAALPLWKTIPFYALADTSISSSFAEVAADTLAADFQEKYDLSLDLPKASGLKTLVIPTSIQGSIKRDLEQELDTATDSLTITADIRHTSINLFGAYGYLPLFMFYQSDAFSQSLSGTTTMTKGEDTEWQANLRHSAYFDGFVGARLGITNSLVLSSSAWSEGIAIKWTAPAPKSLLSFLYSWMVNGLTAQKNNLVFAPILKAETKKERQESLQFTISDGDKFSWTLSLGHESFIRIPGHLTLSAFAKLGVESDEDSEAIDITGSIGTSLTISY